jgi:hypothetical protein
MTIALTSHPTRQVVGCKQSLRSQGSQKGAAKPAEMHRADEGFEERQLFDRILPDYTIILHPDCVFSAIKADSCAH